MRGINLHPSVKIKAASECYSKCCLSYYSLSCLALKPFIMIRPFELCIVGFSFKEFSLSTKY